MANGFPLRVVVEHQGHRVQPRPSTLQRQRRVNRARMPTSSISEQRTLPFWNSPFPVGIRVRRGQRGHKESRESRATKVSKARKVRRAIKESRALSGQRGHRERQALASTCWAPLITSARQRTNQTRMRVTYGSTSTVMAGPGMAQPGTTLVLFRVRRVQKAHKVRKASRGSRGHRENKGSKARRETRGHKALKASRETRGRRESRGLRDQLDQKGRLTQTLTRWMG